ncbi:MAG: hypothetical protein Q9222_005460 [Ikaeria aurantiellina]
MEGDSGIISSVALVVTTIAILFTAVNYFLGPVYDPREPPVIHQKIPHVGHIIGLLQYGLRYFEVLSKKYPLPVFTLQTLGKRIYVVNSPDLISAVQKNAKVLSFNPFVSFMSPKIFDCGEEGMRIINENLDGEKGPWGLLLDISKGMHNALAPSDSLDWMTRIMLNKMQSFIDPLGAGEKDVEIDLYKWVRTAFTVSSTEAIYGPKNPFNHIPDLENAFWFVHLTAYLKTQILTIWTLCRDFEDDITMILLGLAPSVTARKGYRARIKFTTALDAYFADDGPATGSDLIKARWTNNVKYGAAKYASRFEIGDLIGVLINATPTFFWVLVHIYSRPELLHSIRQEVTGIVSEQTAEASPTNNKKTVGSIDVSKLKESCPLLLSTYQETLRVQTHNTSSRWVTKDTMLADQYFLKADSVIQMPGYPVHTMPSLWGTDPETFNPHRFIKIEKSSQASGGAGDGKGAAKQHPASFRSFGGGATLCPGRHFATAEICASVAMFVMRFDMAPAAKKGGWVVPEWKHGKVASAVPPPKWDVRVKVRARRKEGGAEWRFGMEGSVNRFEVLSGGGA